MDARKISLDTAKLLGWQTAEDDGSNSNDRIKADGTKPGDVASVRKGAVKAGGVKVGASKPGQFKVGGVKIGSTKTGFSKN